MPKPIPRTFDCIDCGERVTRRLKSTQALRCVDCGMRHAAEYAYQMARQSGEAWDAWLASRGPEGGRASRRHKE